MMITRLRIIGVLCCLLIAANAPAQSTYYVSSSSGSDSNDGLSKTFTAPNHGPWAHAPGMLSATGVPAAYHPGGTPNSIPGDTFIFKGCDVWVNTDFNWFIISNSLNQGYYSANTDANHRFQFLGDQDKTWYNTGNCPNGWDRPVLDGCLVPAPTQNNLPGCTGGNVAEIQSPFGYRGDFLVVYVSYVTLSGFEIRNHYYGHNGDRSSGQYAAINMGSQSANFVNVRNFYYHAWINSPTAITTGTMTQGSAVMNVASTANMQVGYPIQINDNNSSTLPFTGNGPLITAINGPTSVTVSESAQDNVCALVACPVQAGSDNGGFWSSSGYPANIGSVLESNVIDGFDTQLVQNDTSCIASGAPGGAVFTQCLGAGTAFWNGAIVRNNVIRYIPNGYIGSATEFSGNLYENMRISANPTQHENAFENLSDPATGLLLYNNVFRGIVTGVPIWYAPMPKFTTTGSITAGSNTLTVASTSGCGIGNCGFSIWFHVLIKGAGPGGSDFLSIIDGISGNTITLRTAASTTVSAQTVTTGGIFPTYVWNNVHYNGLRNIVFESAYNINYGANGGTLFLWNNTAQGGPNGLANYSGSNCPSYYQACTFQNNFFITSASALSECGTNCTQDHNIIMTQTQANTLGYTALQTYGFSPTTATVGAAVDLSSKCAIQTPNGALSSLCADTSYAVAYDRVRHNVILPARVPLSRPAGAWQVGAYQFSGAATGGVQPPSTMGVTSVK